MIYLLEPPQHVYVLKKTVTPLPHVLVRLNSVKNMVPFTLTAYSEIFHESLAIKVQIIYLSEISQIEDIFFF
jgi:hypothetical protein